ncbi:MAG: GGDEF domain-containing protein [Thermoleophilia bacterium]
MITVDNGAAIVARKVGAAIRTQENSVMREWLKELIDDLGLASLNAFPVSELSAGLPRMIATLAEYLEDPSGTVIADQGLDKFATCIATLRQEDASLARTIADYTSLKKLLLTAAAGDLRGSDQAVIQIVNTLDDGFFQVFLVGLEAFVERHSLELQHLADTDPLTGLYNVRYFRRQLHQQLEMYKRYRIAFSLIMFDLDELKQLNDIRGHEAGDAALTNLAVIIKKEKRETDIAVRYGGDEFFLLMPGTAADEGERLAYRISRRVKELNLRTRGEEITGVSIGIVSCPDNGTEVGALRAKADRAMYLAKTLGGGTVARYRDFQEC